MISRWIIDMVPRWMKTVHDGFTPTDLSLKYLFMYLNGVTDEHGMGYIAYYRETLGYWIYMASKEIERE